MKAKTGTPTPIAFKPPESESSALIAPEREPALVVQKSENPFLGGEPVERRDSPAGP